MDLGKPAAGGPNKIKEMQDKLRTKNIETLESVAETINFKKLPSDPVLAMLWVAATIDKFTTVVPVISEQGSSNGLSRSQTPSSRGVQEPEKGNGVDFSGIVTGDGIERIQDVVRNSIREQRQRSIDFEAVQMFRKLEALPSKKIWIRRRREEIEAELDAKFARANFQAVDSFDHLSRSLFVSPEEIQDLYVRKEIIARNKWRNLLLKVLCGNSQPDKRESAANHRQLANIHELKGALASSSKGQTALLEAFKVLAGSKSVMGQVLSVYRYIADMDPMKDAIPSPLSETDRSASTNSDKTLRLRTSHLTSRDATVGPFNAIDAQHVKDMKQNIAIQTGYYNEATKVLIEMADRDFNIAHKISFAGPPMYPHSTPFPTYGTPNYIALLMNPQYPSLGPFGYSLPYVGQPLHSQDTPHSTSDTVSYDSPYANTDPSAHRNPTQDPKSHATPSNNTLISSEDSAPRGAKRKRNSHTSRRISRSKAGRIERKPTTTTAISEEDIEAQKDMFEREGKVYPQTLGELDALLTMANGGILPGRLSHETEMEVDNDATESDNGPANEATNAFTTRTGEGQDDEDIKAIVDSIVDDMMAFRDWQGRLPPGTYNAALYDSKRGLHLISELKRLVALARPLVNVVVPVKVGHSISVFDRHLSTRAFTRKMPVPVPSVPYGTDMLPPPAPRSGGKRKRR